jgi:helicase MOV-10
MNIKGLITKDRPSLLVGDFIDVRRVGAPDNEQWIRGVIFDIPYALEYLEVFFRDGDFSLYRGNNFDVRFVLNNLPFRRAHAAVDEKPHQRVLFPTTKQMKAKLPPTAAQKNAIASGLAQDFVANDEEQLLAVSSIVNSPTGNVPFVIFGP